MTTGKVAIGEDMSAVKLEFDSQQQVEAFLKTPYHYQNQFDIAPGQYTFRMAFSSDSSGAQGFGTVILRADLKEQGRWRGPGHCAVFNDGEQYYIVYHAYDKANHGVPTLRIDPIVWTDDGWPTVQS